MCRRGNTVEVIIEGKSISVDSCLANDVKEINERSGWKTRGSCCGHGKYHKSIVLISRRFPERGMREFYTGVPIPRKRNFYRKDADGIYYLPELPLVKDSWIAQSTRPKSRKAGVNRIGDKRGQSEVTLKGRD